MTETSSLSVEILVVEDDEEIRETIATLLRYRGFQVTTAKDGAAAWYIMPADAIADPEISHNRDPA
jgi:DNA-binding response OmpR family regulator